jgi:hypothetical protein
MELQPWGDVDARKELGKGTTTWVVEHIPEDIAPHSLASSI